MDWSILLFAFKWLFLGLVYLMLFLLLAAVQREMRLRVPSGAGGSSGLYGRLRVLQGGSDGRLRAGALLLLQPETVLGSQPGSDLVVLDHFVSGSHARLHWDGISWWVEDLNSTNGTFVNQQRLQPGVSHPLPNGSVLAVGDAAFELVEP